MKRFAETNQLATNSFDTYITSTPPKKTDEYTIPQSPSPKNVCIKRTHKFSLRVLADWPRVKKKRKIAKKVVRVLQQCL